MNTSSINRIFLCLGTSVQQENLFLREIRLNFPQDKTIMKNQDTKHSPLHTTHHHPIQDQFRQVNRVSIL